MSDVVEVTVDGLWRQGSQNLAVRLVARDGRPLPAWQPGAHIDLHLPCGIIRQYSLTGPEDADDGYLICVALEKASRGGSRYIHQQLRPGQTLLISPPRNLFPLRAAERVTLLAAGIGITPLYAMALRLEAEGVPFTLHYYLKNRAQGVCPRTAAAIPRRKRGDSQLLRRRQRPAAFSRRAEQDAYRISDLSLRARGIYGRRAPGRHGTRLGGNADP